MFGRPQVLSQTVVTKIPVETSRWESELRGRYWVTGIIVFVVRRAVHSKAVRELRFTDTNALGFDAVAAPAARRSSCPSQS